MRSQLYSRLCTIARRDCGQDAEDVVQEALLVAVRSGRADLGDAATARWLAGVVRNKARMAARGLARSRRRDAAWTELGAGTSLVSEPDKLPDQIISRLPPSLRAVVVLALTGHNRREIGYLLRLDDAALRQRIAKLKARLCASGIELQGGMLGLNLDVAYGRIRDALLPLLLRQGGYLASHDPDGHLFVLKGSQKP